MKIWARMSPGRPAVEEPPLPVTPGALLRQKPQRAPVNPLPPALQAFLRQHEAGWRLLAKAQAGRLPVQGLTVRSQALGQVLTRLLPQPAAARRPPTLPEHAALLQRLPGRPQNPLAALSAGLSLPAEVR